MKVARHRGEIFYRDASFFMSWKICQVNQPFLALCLVSGKEGETGVVDHSSGFPYRVHPHVVVDVQSYLRRRVAGLLDVLNLNLSLLLLCVDELQVGRVNLAGGIFDPLLRLGGHIVDGFVELPVEVGIGERFHLRLKRCFVFPLFVVASGEDDCRNHHEREPEKTSEGIRPCFLKIKFHIKNIKFGQR